jgi:hypothetical protein
MKDTDRRTVAIFDSLGQVEEGIEALTEAGIKRRKISVVTQSLETVTKIHGYITHGEVTREGAGVGAWTGGLFGLLVGAAFFWVPGFGPLLVAGSLASALVGGVEGAAIGAAGGGLLGVLLGGVVEKRHIPKYEEAIKSGKYLLVVSGSTEDVEQSLRVLENRGGEVSMHAL